MKKKTKTTTKTANQIKERTTVDIEASSRRVADPIDIKKIASAAERLRSIQRDIERTEGRLQELKQLEARVQFEEIPGLMELSGVTEFKLNDGSRVTIKPVIKASLPTENWIARTKDPDERSMLQDRLSRGMEYLRVNGAAVLIKHGMSIDLGKGNASLVSKVRQELRRLGVEATVHEGVHPQTLTAWIRERLTEGKPVDMELFSVFSGNIAKIDYPKTKQEVTEKW